MQVKTNAEAQKEIDVALGFGAQGVGLCRTEHMFFEEAKIKIFRQMIVAKDDEGR